MKLKNVDKFKNRVYILVNGSYFVGKKAIDNSSVSNTKDESQDQTGNVNQNLLDGSNIDFKGEAEVTVGDNVSDPNLLKNIKVNQNVAKGNNLKIDAKIKMTAIKNDKGNS